MPQPKPVKYTLDDPRWISFTKALEARGYGLKCIWHASDEIRIWAVYCARDGVPQPKHTTIVTRHYLESAGFGVWLESRTNSFDAGAVEIIEGLEAARMVETVKAQDMGVHP